MTTTSPVVSVLVDAPNQVFVNQDSPNLLQVRTARTGDTGAGYAGVTSATSVSIGAGTKVFTLSTASSAFATGARVRASAVDPANYMEGIVTISGTTMTMTCDSFGGSSFFASWNIHLAGDKGATGATGGSYVHTQSSASSTWTVTHNLGYYPGGISVIDSGESIVVGDVTHTSMSQFTVSFSTAFSGKVYVS
jgi:hypothetical protein